MPRIHPSPAGALADRDGRRNADDPLALIASPAWEHASPLTVTEARRAFDAVERFTIGIEEELMLVDPGTLELRVADTQTRVDDATPGSPRSSTPSSSG